MLKAQKAQAPKDTGKLRDSLEKSKVGINLSIAGAIERKATITKITDDNRYCFISFCFTA